MNYRVIWQPIAEQELAEVWIASAQHSAVTSAAAWFDHSLAREPLNLGESRASPLCFVAFKQPLGIEYEVVPDDNLVIVQAVFAAG